MEPTPPAPGKSSPIPSNTDTPQRRISKASRFSIGGPSQEADTQASLKASREGVSTLRISNADEKKDKRSSKVLLQKELAGELRMHSSSRISRDNRSLSTPIPIVAPLNLPSTPPSPKSPLQMSPSSHSSASSSRKSSLSSEPPSLSLSNSPQSITSNDSPPTSALTPPKSRPLQLIDLYLTQNPNGEFNFRLDSVLYSHFWFMTTHQLLMAIDASFRDESYSVKQKESLLTLAMRLFTMKRAMPLTDLEIDVLNNLGKVCKAHTNPELAQKGTQLQTLLPRSIGPVAPSPLISSRRSQQGSQTSLIPLEHDKFKLKCLSTLLSGTNDLSDATAKTFYDIGIKYVKRICLDEFYMFTKKKELGAPPNLTMAISFFNQLSYFVTYEITKVETSSPHNRARIYEFFIKVCTKLQSFNDFNSCMAILGGLSNIAVGRMKSMLEFVDKKLRVQLEQLEAQMDPLKALRIKMSTIEKNNIPYVPYIGLFLTDLNKCTEGRSFDNKIIDPEIAIILAKPLITVAKGQYCTAFNEERPEIIELFESWQKIYLSWESESIDIPEHLRQRSLAIEPPKKVPGPTGPGTV